MKKWVSLVAILAVALLEAMLVDHFKVFGAKPDLLLITLVILAGFFLFQLPWLITLAIIAGIFKDIFSANIFGVNTLLFCAWAILIVRISKRISIDDDLRRAALIFALALLDSISTRIILVLWGNPIAWGIFLRIGFLNALYTLIVSPLMFRIPWRRLSNHRIHAY